jgi:exonuclease III
MKHIAFILSLVLIISFSNAQDTIRIMTYNLLNYSYYPTYCNESINNIDEKNNYINTIIDYTLPDIIGFVEVYNSESVKYSLLGVMNSNGRNFYQPTSFNTPNSLSGIVYYNKNKFEVVAETDVSVDGLRNLRIYSLKRKETTPEIIVNVVLGHLDTGQDGEQGRAEQIAALYNKLEQQGHNNNYMIMGDLNVYHEDEAMFDDILRHSNEELRFYDPIEMMDNNGAMADLGSYEYRHYHTQSTSAYNNPNQNECFATGGLDDRFDMILVDDDIISGEGKILYIEDSYTTPGQDGYHYNTYLTDGANNSAPANVIEALQKNSDHLPVYADFVFGEPAGIANFSNNNLKVSCKNPATENLEILIKLASPDAVEICIYNVLGNPLLKTSSFIKSNENINIPINNLHNGMYILSVKTTSEIRTLRFIKE